MIIDDAIHDSVTDVSWRDDAGKPWREFTGDVTFVPSAITAPKTGIESAVE